MVKKGCSSRQLGRALLDSPKSKMLRVAGRAGALRAAPRGRHSLPPPRSGLMSVGAELRCLCRDQADRPLSDFSCVRGPEPCIFKVSHPEMGRAYEELVLKQAVGSSVLPQPCCHPQCPSSRSSALPNRSLFRQRLVMDMPLESQPPAVPDPPRHKAPTLSILFSTSQNPCSSSSLERVG